MATIPASDGNSALATEPPEKGPAPTFEWLSSSWQDRLVRFVAHGKKAAALAMLEAAISEALPLFGAEPAVFEARRSAWLIRAQLLLEWGRPAEALAWTCLECQLADTRNVPAADAKALRDRLLRQLSLDFSPQPVAAIRTESQWPGVAGMHDLKARLERDLIGSVRYPEYAARYGLRPPNGILLYGPPGCGKTFFARKIAEKLGFQFIEINPGDIASVYVHGTQERIAEAFARAQESAPTVLFFDEFDGLVPHRAEVSHAYAGEVNEFLVRLDNCAEKRILVVAATNYPEKIDAAVLRPGRIEQHFYVGLPDFAARAELFRHHLEALPHRRLDWDQLAAKAEGYTAADITYLCQQAARLALRESQALRVFEETPISPPHFEVAMREHKPTAVPGRHDQIGFRAHAR